MVPTRRHLEENFSLTSKDCKRLTGLRGITWDFVLALWANVLRFVVATFFAVEPFASHHNLLWTIACLRVAVLVVHFGDGRWNSSVDVASFTGPPVVALASGVVAFALAGAFLRAKHVLQLDARFILAVPMIVPNEKFNATLFEDRHRVFELLQTLWCVWSTNVGIIESTVVDDLCVLGSKLDLARVHLFAFDHERSVQRCSALLQGFGFIIRHSVDEETIFDARNISTAFDSFFCMSFEELGDVFYFLVSNQRLEESGFVRTNLLLGR
jgi:hypothetical protein